VPKPRSGAVVPAPAKQRQRQSFCKNGTWDTLVMKKLLAKNDDDDDDDDDDDVSYVV